MSCHGQSPDRRGDGEDEVASRQASGFGLSQ